jgi:chromosome segregation ATPase
LPLYAKKKEDYCAEVEQFKDLIRQMFEHKSTLEQKIKDRTSQLADTNVKLDKMTTHIDNLKQAIQEQEFTVDDIRRMEVEIKGLTEAKERAMLIKEQQLKMKKAAEDEFKTTSELLLSTTNTYNQKISSSQTVPELAGKFTNFKATLQIGQILDSHPDALLGVNLTQKVQPVTKSCLDDLHVKQQQAEEIHNDLLDELTHTEGLCMETEALLKIAEEKNSQSIQAIETERKSHEAKTTIRKREVEGMESKIESLHNPVSLEEQMAAYHRQCADLEALRMEHQDENVAKREAVLEQINSACQLMADHDAFFRQSVVHVKQFWQQKISETGKINLSSKIDSSGDD